MTKTCAVCRFASLGTVRASFGTAGSAWPGTPATAAPAAAFAAPRAAPAAVESAAVLRVLLLPKAVARLDAAGAEARPAVADTCTGGAAGIPLCLRSKLWYTEMVRLVMKSNTCSPTAHNMLHWQQEASVLADRCTCPRRRDEHRDPHACARDRSAAAKEPDNNAYLLLVFQCRPLLSWQQRLRAQLLLPPLHMCLHVLLQLGLQAHTVWGTCRCCYRCARRHRKLACCFGIARCMALQFGLLLQQAAPR